jgi:hypothetical protein
VPVSPRRIAAAFATALVLSVAAASCAASGTPAPTNANVPGAAPALEAMLPSSAGGLTFSKSSFDGAKVGAAGLPLDMTTLDTVLKANGKTAADVSYAVATAPAPSGKLATTVMAMRIAGVDAAITAGMSNGTPQGMTDETLGGKQVKQGGSAGFWAVIYLKGDVMFEAMGADIATLDAVIAALP